MERKDQELAVVGSFLCLGGSWYEPVASSRLAKSTVEIDRLSPVQTWGWQLAATRSSTKYFPTAGISTLSGATTSHSPQVHQWWT